MDEAMTVKPPTPMHCKPCETGWAGRWQPCWHCEHDGTVGPLTTRTCMPEWNTTGRTNR
jgi:hypothetical protein